MRPLEATMLVIIALISLSDISPKARRQWLRTVRRRLKLLPMEVPYSELSRNGQIDFEILRDELLQSGWRSTPYRSKKILALRQLHQCSVYSLLTQSTLPKEITSGMRSRDHAHSAYCQDSSTDLRELRRRFWKPPSHKIAARLDLRKEFSYLRRYAQAEELRKVTTQAVAALTEHQIFWKTASIRANGEWRLGRHCFQRSSNSSNAGCLPTRCWRMPSGIHSRQREMYVSRAALSHIFPARHFRLMTMLVGVKRLLRGLVPLSQEHGKPENLITDAPPLSCIQDFIREHDIRVANRIA